MYYCTDNNQIKQLMLETADVEVKELNALVTLPLKDVTLYLFDTRLFGLRLPDSTVRSDFLLLLRPDWGGMILKLMKTAKVYLNQKRLFGKLQNDKIYLVLCGTVKIA